MKKTVEKNLVFSIAKKETIVKKNIGFFMHDKTKYAP